VGCVTEGRLDTYLAVPHHPLGDSVIDAFAAVSLEDFKV